MPKLWPTSFWKVEYNGIRVRGKRRVANSGGADVEHAAEGTRGHRWVHIASLAPSLQQAEYSLLIGDWQKNMSLPWQ